MRTDFYLAMADAVLILHLAFIGWVIFGALSTRGRPRLALVHIATVVYGIIAETTPLVCPLTLAENYFEELAGILPYHGPFLLHYLDRTVYPQVPVAWIVAGAVLVCAFNLGVYVRRYRRHASLG